MVRFPHTKKYIVDNMDKLTLTIGIPAYNEASNIGALLNSILCQTGVNFNLKKIIVVVDKSSDGTERIVQSVNDPRIILKVNSDRLGQNQAQNYIFEQADTDAVILMEADTLPKNNLYLENLLDPLSRDGTIRFIQGNVLPVESATTIGRVVSMQSNIYNNFLIERQSGRWFTSGRGGRLFMKEVYSKLRWPNSVPEDAYALSWCTQNNTNLAISKNAVCFYRVPETLGDFIKERSKVRVGKESLKKYFPIAILNKVYELSAIEIIKLAYILLFSSPSNFVYYLVIKLISLTNKFYLTFDDNWSITLTTKKLL